MIKVEVKNEILGNSVFWEGQPEDVDELRNRNMIAWAMARATALDGVKRESGMWHVSVSL
jgi:hypothetical protein